MLFLDSNILLETLQNDIRQLHALKYQLLTMCLRTVIETGLSSPGMIRSLSAGSCIITGASHVLQYNLVWKWFVIGFDRPPSSLVNRYTFTNSQKLVKEIHLKV